MCSKYAEAGPGGAGKQARDDGRQINPDLTAFQRQAVHERVFGRFMTGVRK